MKPNVTLIGMPGSGKSTVGIILAKYLTFGFIDTDVLIQINQQKSLQEILDESDYLHLRGIEEQEILKINIQNHVISTGGSAVYSEREMSHLQDISKIAFLKWSLKPSGRGSTILIHGVSQKQRARLSSTCFMKDRSCTGSTQNLLLTVMNGIRRR
jgi:shikimate kinase